MAVSLSVTSLAVLSLLLVSGSGGLSTADAATLTDDFQQSVVFDGLMLPTTVRFASDGRVFVAEKHGVIKVFDSLTDSTPTIFADLNVNVYSRSDRGLLGLELDPNFPVDPYVYALYAYDGDIGGPAPKWGTPGVYSDQCPTPPGANDDGCVTGARLVRLEADGNTMTGEETVLIEDWCQQYSSHTIGSLAFGADGALYASAGDAASFQFVDYGQDGDPVNPCGDPPGGVGSQLTPPTAEGGALRSQDLRTMGDPVTLDGTVIRVDPDSGAGLPDNPLASSADANAQKIVAYGFRNAFRFTIRPGTNELWIGDVGLSRWEEINHVQNSTGGAVTNFGWPCYEGAEHMPGYDAADLDICEDLYQEGSAADPYFAYWHGDNVVDGENCPTGSASITGLAFYEGGAYPASYNDALFFADYSRNCIWVLFPGVDGLPDPDNRATFIEGAASPVDLQIGPGGDLYYVDLIGGEVVRVQHFGTNQPPTASAEADPVAGDAPLSVDFDGTSSSDPDPGDTLTYAWDLDGDGSFDDSSASQPGFTYTQPGTYVVGLEVTDQDGARDTDTVIISVQNSPPLASIDAPSPTDTWAVSDLILFSGSAQDAQDGQLPASAFEWELILHHCPSTCHAHPIQSFSGTKTGSFTGIDHEYPSHLELRLTVTDSLGLSDTRSVLLYPKTVVLSLDTIPTGLDLALNGAVEAAPFSRTLIQGSNNTISAPSPQMNGGQSYDFASWTDGGARTHNVIAEASGSYTAEYVPSGGGGPSDPPPPDDGGSPVGPELVEPSGASNLVSAKCKGSDATIVGTPESDVLRGTPGRDVVAALGGDDVVWGLGGNDLVCLGSGDDLAYGGSGVDRVYGQAGNDRVHGGANGDYLAGGIGIDVLLGGRGQDELRGGYGGDWLHGNLGHDVLRGQRGSDRLRGNRGEDRLIGGRGRDHGNGGRGTDVCFTEFRVAC